MDGYRVYKPVADTYVTATRARANFGARVLRVDASPETTAFVRFRLKRLTAPAASVTLLLRPRSPGRARYAVRRVEDNKWRERRLTYATAPIRHYGSRPHAQSDVEPGAQSTSRPSSRRAMKRSASRSRHGRPEISFGSRESQSGPRLVVRTDDGELNNLVLDAILRHQDRSGATQAGETRPAPPAVLHSSDERCASRRDRRPAPDRPRARESRGRAAATRRRATGRGRPEDRAHGYPPFRGLPALREAIAERPTLYGVDVDPDTEVAVVPGTKTALVELAVALAERESTVLLPDPGYPDYPSGVALAAAQLVPLRLVPAAGWAPAWAEALGTTSRPCTSTTRQILAPPPRRRRLRERGALRAGDGRRNRARLRLRRSDVRRRSPESFLATAGAKEVGVEMFSMSKTYGMAGWRLGFVLGNAEIVGRVDLLQDHARAGILPPSRRPESQRSPAPGLRAGTGRPVRGARDRVVEALRSTRVPPPVSEGLLRAWLELPDGVTVERLLAEARVALAPGEGSAPPAPAGRGCRSR